MKRPAIPRRRARKRSGIRDEDGPLRCPAHLTWIRGFECLIDDRDCPGLLVEAAHVRMGMGGGMGLKPPDDRTVPLCTWHHGLQHKIGENSFWRRYDIDPLAIAARLAAQSPALARLRAKHRRESE